MGRLALVVPLALAAMAVMAPGANADHHPGVPERVEGVSVYDDGILGEVMSSAAEDIIGTITNVNGVDVVVVTHRLPGPIVEPDEHAAMLAEALVEDWGIERAVVFVVEAGPDGCNAGAAIWTVGHLDGATINRATIVTETLRPAIEGCDPALATFQGVVEIVRGLAGVGTLAPASAAGPPFPDPEQDRAVYDEAKVFSAETIASAERTIDAIEARTGAEVVVYSQVVDYGITIEEAEGHARALMDEWGVGRKGFDDGLVILFDLDPSRVHGQVQLYGGPGYRAAFLDNGEKQRIFDEDMLPLLEAGDLDGALLVALERVDANATPEHASKLQTARQLDAAMGLILAPVILIGLIGTALFAWMRYGRDPVYLDDPSIHMAGPPRDLTPATATFVLSGGPSRRALTTAMLDLASRGVLAFREEKTGLLGMTRKIGIELAPSVADPKTKAEQARNAVRALGPAEAVAKRRLRALASGDENYIDPTKLLEFGSAVGEFDTELESHVVNMGWFREKPSAAEGWWMTRAVIAIVLGFVAFFAAINLPSSGFTMIAASLVISGVIVLVISRWMDAVTMPGAMIRAMLAAYRRTLQKTMAQSRSMDQVVANAGLDWLETPDQAVVWGTALGLEKEIEDVLERSLDDVKDKRASAGAVYMPAWYGTGGSGGWGSGDGGGGLFSSSAIPNVGGMMSALGTIGNSPSSSGSGGGFGGGGSGGGGGGSGGGF